MYKNCPDELVAEITTKMDNIRASGYKYPTTYNIGNICENKDLLNL